MSQKPSLRKIPQSVSRAVTGYNAQSPDYKKFWDQLRSGEFQKSTFKRVTKSGDVVWISGSYNPVLDGNGNVLRVVKYATDVTDGTLQEADYSGQVDAISKSQAVISFEMVSYSPNVGQIFL